MSFKFGTVVLENGEGVEISSDKSGKLQVKLSVGAAGDVSTEIPLPVTMEAVNQILKELKIINIHLAIITDNMITEEI